MHQFLAPVRTGFAVLFCALAVVSARAADASSRAAAGPPRLVVQLGHPAGVWCVAFSPDGHKILTGGADSTAMLWDAETGQELRTFKGHLDSIAKVGFSRDGRRVLTASADKTVKLWDAETGQEIRTIRLGVATSLAFSPDGRRVLTADASSGTATLWDAETGHEIRTIQNAATGGVAFSPDGRSLLTGILEAAKLWDADTGRELRTFKGHSNFVWSVAFSADGRRVLTGSDGTAKLWDAETGQQLRTFSDDSFEIWEQVAFSPDGRRVLTASEKGHVKLWDAETAKEIPTLQLQSDKVMAAAFSPDGTTVLTGSEDAQAKLWDVKTGREVRTFRGYSSGVLSVAFSPDGRRVLAGHMGKAVDLWDMAMGQQIRTLSSGSDEVLSVAFSPNGRRVLTGSTDKTAKLWDEQTGQELRTFTGHSNFLRAVAFSPDGRRVLTGSADNTAKLWDEQLGQEIRTFTGHSGTVTSVAFSPDGRRVLTGSEDRTAKLWDPDTGQELCTLKGHSAYVRAVAFSPDGRRVLTGSQDGTAKLWDAETGQELRTFKGHFQLIQSVAFSPNGRTVLTGSGDGTAKLWDVETGQELRTFLGHSSVVMSVAFSPDGRSVLTGSVDGTIKLWDAETGREQCGLISFTDGNWAVVDPEGRYDASNGGDVAGLHWVIGDTPIALSQLKQRYYDPGLLAKHMNFDKEPLLEVTKLEAPRLFPAVALEAPTPGTTTLHMHLVNQGGGIGKVRVLVNGKEIAGDARGPRPNTNAVKADLKLDLAGAAILPGKANRIQVVAWNAEGYLSSRGVEVEWTAPGNADTHSPELYAIVSGVSEYANSALRLNFASRDAEAFAHALEIGANRLFGAGHVHVTLLASSARAGQLPPTKENLQKAFAAAQRAKPADVLVVYLAGHGVALKDLYAYPTAEARSLELSDPAVRSQAAVTSDELVDWIKKIPAQHQVMILDTCAAGAVASKLVEKRDVPGDQVRALDQLKDRTGFYVLMGSAANAVSYEASKYGQGLLTYALLTGMKGAALKNDVDVDVGKLFQFAVDDVPELARGIGGVQRPQIIAPTGGASFDVGQLEPEDQKQIQLATEKPIFLRPQLVNAEGPDDLELAAAVRRELRDETHVSGRGGPPAPDAVFVDADEMPGAIRVSGTYVAAENRVTVQLWLAREKVKTHVVVDGQADDVSTLAMKITAAILNAGKQL